jgi:magnesium transporter
MITVFVRERGGVTQVVESVRPEWLAVASGVTVWVDMAAPTTEETRVLADVFHFHPLSVEDAQSALQFPKVESFPNYIYVVLHGIDVQADSAGIATRDVDFFVGANFLVTVHDGGSRSIARLRTVCGEHAHILAEGPVALMHRIVDTMVDNYRPAMNAIETRVETLEDEAFQGQEQMVRHVLHLRRDLAFMRRVLTPQRDVIGRLARREFPAIADEMAYRFRDVYDHVVRLADETILFQERLTGVVDVHYATVSNRMNQVMKVLTVMSTIFLPLTVLTGMWGMNIPVPHFFGSPEAQFWWILALMLGISLAMIVVFRRNDWI